MPQCQDEIWMTIDAGYGPVRSSSLQTNLLNGVKLYAQYAKKPYARHFGPPSLV